MSTSRPLHNIFLAGILICAASLAGCRDTSEPESVTPSFSDIVTYEGTGADGAVFTLLPANDNTPITLTTATSVDPKQYEPQSRVYIRYTSLSGKPYQSGEINLSYIANINTGALKALDMSQHPDWNATGVYLYSIWRSGPYINLHARLPYNPEPRKIALVIDKERLDDTDAHLYFMHVTKPEYDTFERDYFMSYDMSEFLSEHSPERLTVHVNNTNMPQSEFKFELATYPFVVK